MQEINKWVYWCYNYTDPKVWIYQIWSGCIADHMYAKFNRLYEIYGYRSVMQDFYVDIDKENRKMLLQWVLENYSDEPKLM